MNECIDSLSPIETTSPASSLDPISALLAELILPSLVAVQASQVEQLAANARLEDAIAELRMHLDAQFAHLLAQLTACRAELAATQAVLRETQARGGTAKAGASGLVH